MDSNFPLLLLAFFITAGCSIFHPNKVLWFGLLVFWCLMIAIREYFLGGAFISLIWVFNAAVWFNSYLKGLKEYRAERKKSNGPENISK